MKTLLNPYLMFEANAAQAIEFYHSIFGGELIKQTYGEAGMSNDPQQQDKLIHSQLTSDEVCIMASDSHPEHSPKIIQGNNVHLSLVGANSEKLTEYFTALADGGTITMPLEKQFWGDTYGMLTDKFGIHWTVNISADTDRT
jgi:PhnB protein